MGGRMETPIQLQIRVTADGTIEYRPTGEQGWATDGGPPPPEALRAQNVWEALQGQGEEPWFQQGYELGRWLYDHRATGLLTDHAARRGTRLRVELGLPAHLEG